MELGQPLGRASKRSARFIELLWRLDQLRFNLGIGLPGVPKSQAEVDQLHGYRVLAHSEIEEFIELIASTVTDVTEHKMRVGILTHAGHHLLVVRSVLRASRTDDAAKARYPLYRTVDAVGGLAADPDDLRAAIEQQRSRIGSNHGVKAKNVRGLLLPLGFREECFLPGLLDKLDDLGEKRGSVAHKTGAIGVAQWPTGSSELGAIVGVLPGLERLDGFVARLLAPAGV